MKEKALYVHIPFCAKKCLYCDFPSFCGKETMMMDYAEALSSEITTAVENNSFDTIFVGGGTPTYLSLEAWLIIGDALVKAIRNRACEFTVECNPGTVNAEKLKFFKAIGVNRLSIGVQAWQNNLLQKLGRIHKIEDFLSTYECARLEGFKNINVDLMFGLPNQSIEQWKETLKETLRLKPEHISCYSLIVEEGTAFYDLNEKKLLKLPEEEDERLMYHLAQEILEQKGYKQYEISNFALHGRECRHNIIYWKLKDYIGCGAAAHSYNTGFRYRNEENIEKYISMIRENKCAVIEEEKNSVKADMEEFMFMGLRMMEGISENEFFIRFGVSVGSVYEKVIAKHVKDKLLQQNCGRIFLTQRGIELSNTVMSDFLLD